MKRVEPQVGIWWTKVPRGEMQTVLHRGLVPPPFPPQQLAEGCTGYPPYWIGRDDLGGIRLTADAARPRGAWQTPAREPFGLVGVVLDTTTPGVTPDEWFFSRQPDEADSVTGQGGIASVWKDALWEKLGWNPRPYPWDQAAQMVLDRSDLALQEAIRLLDQRAQYLSFNFPAGGSEWLERVRAVLARPRVRQLYAIYLQRRAVMALSCGWRADQESQAQERRRWPGFDRLKGRPFRPFQAPPVPRIFHGAWERIYFAFDRLAEAIREIAWTTPGTPGMQGVEIRVLFPLRLRGRNRVVLVGMQLQNQVVIHHLDSEYAQQAVTRLVADYHASQGQTLRVRWAGGATLYESWGPKWDSAAAQWVDAPESPWPSAKVQRGRAAGSAGSR